MKSWIKVGSGRTGAVYVSEGLPKLVEEFVIDHERYHIIEREQNIYLRELKANIYSAKKHILGFLLTTLLTLTNPQRIALYNKRVIKGY